jgi:hypothetical protein
VRRDGTLRRPVTMWVVRDGDDIYVRSVNGRDSSWFRGAQRRHESRIRAGGVEKDVTLIETDDADAFTPSMLRKSPSCSPRPPTTSSTSVSG